MGTCSSASTVPWYLWYTSRSWERHGRSASMMSSAEEDGERLVADKFPGAENGMPESHGLFLTDIEDLDHFRDLPHLKELCVFSFAVKKVLQLERNVEVVLERPLPPAGNEEYLFDT